LTRAPVLTDNPCFGPNASGPNGVQLPPTFLPARYEFKYGISAALAQQMGRELTHLTRLDPNSQGQSDERYLVRSLYFDTPSMGAYHGKLAGLQQRMKLRVRTYGEDNDGPAFLEVKAKEGPFIRKARMALPEDAPAYGDGEHLLKWLRRNWRPSDSHNDKTLWRLITWPGMRPVVLVVYFRRALTSIGPTPIRITFDHAVCGRSARHLRAYNDGFGLRPAVDNEVILELKFKRTIPSWLSHLIERHELATQSFSKYCLTLEGASPLFDQNRFTSIVDEGLTAPTPSWLYHAPRGGRL
jgi:hypothetical protein